MLDNNIKIARFIGQTIEQARNGTYMRRRGDYWYEILNHEVAYHEDIGTLMRVIDIIEQTKKPPNFESVMQYPFSFIMDGYVHIKIDNDCKGSSHYFKKHDIANAGSRTRAVYNAVLEFVEWYQANS